MTHEVTFEKIVPEGRALARLDGKALFVTGALPGEIAVVNVGRPKKTWAEGTLVSISQASPHRSEPREEHYMSCSPWQGVDYPYQLELKEAMLAELFGRPELDLTVKSMTGSNQPFGYRNKLEFTVETDPYGDLQLTFHARGSFRDLISAEAGCVLGSNAMNQAATDLLKVMQGLDLADFIDTLTVRESAAGNVIAVLLVKREIKRDWKQLSIKGLAGIAVVRKLRHDTYHTDWKFGRLELSEMVGGVALTYPWDSFFQVNIPMFEQALARIMAAVPSGSRVLDLYGGAGTIGLAVARQAASVRGVDIVESSVKLANHNAASAGLTNYKAVTAASENLDPASLEGVDVVIVDPPRAGLHARVVEFLVASQVPRIIYLSCNPATQVRDLVLLKAGGYAISNPEGFDFYPGTLHLESLVILDRS
jgi:23S rRNA (uracil1939-C5)-methyltransferase